MYKTTVYQQLLGSIIGITMQQYTLLLLFTTAQVASEDPHCMRMDKTTGLCTCCYSNYSGPTCSDCPACVQNYSNNTCKKQCDGHTMHGEYCNITCSSTCLAGKCRRGNGYCKQCKDGYHGDLCSKICDCSGGPCEKKTGDCINWVPCHHCVTKRCYKDGKDGTPVCHGTCEGPYYGIDCGKHCSPSCNRCEQGTGSCLPDHKTSTDGVNYALWVVAISVTLITLKKLGVPTKALHVIARVLKKGRCFKPGDNDSPQNGTDRQPSAKSYDLKRSVPPSQEEQEREGEHLLEADRQLSDVSLRDQSVKLPKPKVVFTI